MNKTFLERLKISIKGYFYIGNPNLVIRFKDMLVDIIFGGSVFVNNNLSIDMKKKLETSLENGIYTPHWLHS